MTKDKFKSWLRLWQLGVVEDPDIVATIVDVPRAEDWFYQRLFEKARELEPKGLIQGKTSLLEAIGDPISMNDLYWIGPDEVSAEFTEYVNQQLHELRARNGHRNFVEGEAYHGFRYWAVSGGGRSLQEWKTYWLGTEDLPKTKGWV